MTTTILVATHMSKTIVASALVFLLSSNVRLEAQQLGEQDLLHRLEAYQQQLAVLELEYGRIDPRLVESLTDLAQISMALNQFDGASVALDRAVQIVRISEGLYTNNQFSILQLVVENDAMRGNWENANETLEHLYWLYTNKHRGIDSEVVYELMHLSAFHLEAIASDDISLQSYHFKTSEDITWVAMRVATLVWGSHDPRLAEIQYDLLKQKYLQAIAIDKKGRTGYELREFAPGSTFIRSPRFEERRLYRSGVQLLISMREIFTDAEMVDLQAAAMADLYLADWQLIFGQQDAADSYQLAFENLRDAGVDRASLDEFLSRPVLLPVLQFHVSVSDALDVSAEQSLRHVGFSDQGADNLLFFNEWSATFPDVNFPLGSDSIRFSDTENKQVALLSFTLGAMDNVSRWISGRFNSRMSVASAIEILSLPPDSELDVNYFVEKLHYLQLRPRLINGRAESSQGLLQYEFVTVQD